jgi:hypothetical protein
MLNYKGIYYAKDALEILDQIKDALIDFRIIKISDLNPQNAENLLKISNSVTTIELLENREADIMIRGFSEELINSYKCMGKSNLSLPELSNVSTYYDELKKVKDNPQTISKASHYLRLFFRYYMIVDSQLKTEVEKALMNKDNIPKTEGYSFAFQAGDNDVLTMPNPKEIKEDFFKGKSFFVKNLDYNYIGIKVDNPKKESEDYILVPSDDVVFSKDTIYVNMPMKLVDGKPAQEDLKEKVYEVVSAYKGKRMVDSVSPLVSRGELISVLKNTYHAEISNRVYDNEPLYEALETLSISKANKKYTLIRTGKNTISHIRFSELKGQFAPAVLNARSATEIMSNLNIMTPRDLKLNIGKNKKQSKR